MHQSYLIRRVEVLETSTLSQLEAELKLKFCRFATFAIGNETVIAVLDTTEHTMNRLVEHYSIAIEEETMQEQKKGIGRPRVYPCTRTTTTTTWPDEILAYIKSVTDNRTKWLVEAAQEKMERERTSQS